MSNESINIVKESMGEKINLYPESSDSNSEIQIHRSVRNKKQKKLKKKKLCDIQSSDSSDSEPVNNRKQRRSHQPTLKDDMFEMFTNPEKKIEDDNEYDEVDEEESQQGEHGHRHGDQESYQDNESVYEEEAPSPGYNTIDEEKQDLLYKFYRLQTKGVPLPHKFNMNSNVFEMRREYERIKRDAEVNSSIKFSRRMLMACVTGIEFLNKRYDPFDIKLEGWSESVMENVEDYDNTFERLHDKYKSKVQMAPEIELLLSLAGSAFMFHLTNSMFNSLPNFKDIAKQNPDIINNLMKSMGATQSQQQQAPQQSTEQNAFTENNNNVREMKPPMFDMSSLMGMMQPPPQPETQMPSFQQKITVVSNDAFTNPVPTRISDVTTAAPVISARILQHDSISEVSSDISESVFSKSETKNISFSETTSAGKRRRNKKLNSTPQNTISI